MNKYINTIIRFLRKISYHLTNFYYLLLRKIIPIKIMTVAFRNPFTEIENDILYGVQMARLPKEYFELDDILDAVFNAIQKQMKKTGAKPIPIAGFKYETTKRKYEIFLRGQGYVNGLHPDRLVDNETEN